MKDVTGLLAVALLFLVETGGGTKPNRGFCVGNQCFAVIQEPSDFTTAQKQCSDNRGHLMTVRSTVSDDILHILLGNSTGRFWIGLHLSRACPESDPGAGLRGFQWVTKDDQSDFFNWAPSFDSSCSSPRCVSVSTQSGFKWIQEPCDEPAVGFLCEYSFSEPCKSLPAADGESVTYMTPMGLGEGDFLSLPPGSVATMVPSEAKYVCFSQQWLQAPWSCEIAEGGCEYKCAVDPKHVPSCYCPPGQNVSPVNKVTCEVLPDHPCQKLRCEHVCYENGGVYAYACACDQGYQLAADGRSCVDVDDCMDQRQCPGEGFLCVNTVGGFQCVCQDGYRRMDTRCVDENECGSAPCEHVCVNTPGSYECSCYPGYQVDPKAPDRCKLHCDEEECAAECDPNDPSQCYCPDGYVAEERGSHVFCLDIDECESFFCDQLCENTFGGYVCACKPGYRLVGEYRCKKSDDHIVPSTPTTTTTTKTTTTTAYLPKPDPTRRPSGVSTGAFVAIIIFTTFIIVLVVCLAHHMLNHRGMTQSAGALKAQQGEGHGLHHVTSDA